MAGIGTGAINTSARISGIVDRGGTAQTYTFTYNADAIPHLTGISNRIGTGESYSLAYASQSLTPPFGSAQYAPTTVLQSITVPGLGASNTFTYAASGEMASFTTPLGGSLGWGYRTFTYAGGISIREVQSRSMNSTPGTNSWAFWHPDSYDASQTYHAWTVIYDNTAGTQKVYWPGVTPAGLVVPSGYEERNSDSSANLDKNYSWTTDAAGNPYMNAVTTTLSPGTSSAVQSTSTQTLDIYGNVTQSQVYDYGNAGTPARTYNFSYLYQQNGNYTANYIFNRVTQATATTTSGTVTLVWNTYDQGFLQDQPSLTSHDSAYGVSYKYRGNPTSVWNVGGTSMSYVYQISGVPYQMTDGAGKVVTTSPSYSTAYSLPGVLTPNSNSNLATSVSYAASFAVTSVTGPNGANGTTNYDVYGRPVSSTSPDGAVTNYTYSFLPNIQTATITTGSATQWKKTTLDGFGRPISVQTGHDGTTMTEVDTQYAPCACSPLGKLWRTSVAYAPGQTPVWTTYSYDGSGRTLRIVKPDGASTTTYSYSGNTIRVTDPAGKWKVFTNDASGNLASVTEPDPNNQPNGTMVTNYTYNGANQLIGVSMPRSVPTGGSYTQTRAFQWSGTDLTSTTNPENGTVSYQYDGAHHVTQRTDAKGQQTKYTYDTYGRLTLVQHYNNQGQEQPLQDVNYFYDTDPLDVNFSQNTWGRLAAVTFAGTSTATSSSGNLSVPGTGYYLWRYDTGGQWPNAQNVNLTDNSGAGTWSAVVYNNQWQDPTWLEISVGGGGAATSGSGWFGGNASSLSLVPVSLDSLSDGTHTATVILQDDNRNTLTITVTITVNGWPSYPTAYHYNYNQAGRVVKQRLHIPNPQWDFDATYAWDNQGRMTSQSYPMPSAYAPTSLAYTYDPMGNLSTVMANSYTTVASGSYNFAGQLTSLSYSGIGMSVGETRTYDNQLRLTAIGTTGWIGSNVPMLNETYMYSPNADNGRIVQTVNGLSGETITYAYDALNRLASATSSASWGQQYVYDGFGNLAGMNGGMVTGFNATNQPYGADANGNAGGTFDIENRMVVSGTGMAYAYDAWGKRIGQAPSAASYPYTQTVTFYGVTGQRIQTYSCTTDQGDGTPSCTVQGTNVYFGRKLITVNGNAVATDRLGSVRYTSSREVVSYYPYGQERAQSNGQTTADGRDKFATYFRDGIGQDYADQRYYNQAGRFFSPDPDSGSASPADPQSWNRYSYGLNDPINHMDPSGLDGACGWLPGPDGGYIYVPCPDGPDGGGHDGPVPAGSPTGDSTPIFDGSGASLMNMDLLKKIQSDLDRRLSDPNCAGIFGNAPGFLGFGTSSTPSVANVLDSLIAGGSAFGSIQFVDPTDGSLAGGILGANAAITVADRPFWHTIGFSSSSTVYINSLDVGDNFNTSQVNAETTILHELGHVLSNLNWKGDQIKPDINNPAQSSVNDSIIQSKCGLKR